MKLGDTFSVTSLLYYHESPGAGRAGDLACMPSFVRSLKWMGKEATRRSKTAKTIPTQLVDRAR